MFRASHAAVDIQFEADEKTPDFKFDPDQMKRVLVNLIDNAIAATAEQSSRHVDIEIKYDSDLKILRLTVTDNGTGIPQALRSRVFEPYYSTKESGTGLGLAIVKRIVEDHSGFIRALANEPQGTKMLIELPVNEVGAWRPSSSGI
jgi:two-component system nitrogen regulation sensor histidine kinase NtrY